MDQVERQRSFSSRYGVVLLALVLIGLPATVELGVDIPIPARGYFVYAAFGLALIWLHETRRWTPPARGAALLLISALACLHVVPWSSRKAFLSAFWSVEAGMTVDDVDALLEPFAFSEHQGSPVDVERAYRHQPVGRYDSDVGVVRIRNGRVAETRFTPD